MSSRAVELMGSGVQPVVFPAVNDVGAPSYYHHHDQQNNKSKEPRPFHQNAFSL